MNYRFPFLSLLLCAVMASAAAQNLGGFGATRHGFGSDRLPSNVSVSGMVRTFDNRPVRDARVEIRTLDTGTSIVSGYTLPNGSFELPNVPRGIYEVVATLGVQEAREQVNVDHPNVSLQLRLPGDAAAETSRSAAVSISQLKVPDKAKQLFVKAQEAFEKEKFDQCREKLGKALQIFPNYAQALTLRGLLALHDKQLDQASTELEQAIKNDYSYALAYVVLGATYNLMNRFDDSVRVLERATALSPASWQAYLELSKALLGKGQFEAALRQVNRASALAPPSYGAIHLVKAHALLGVKNYDQAVVELEQYLGSKPDSTDSAKARETLNQVRAFMAANGK
jgi:tetratricopeptide (TPR) repeat protein